MIIDKNYHFELMQQNAKIKDLIYVGLIIIVVIISGLKVFKYYQLNRFLSRDLSVLKEENREFENRLALIEKRDRKIADSSKKRLFGRGCFDENGDFDFDNFNNDQADSFLKYLNEEKGIAFRVPYNNRWGNNECTVKPYLETDKGIVFGNPLDQAGTDKYVLNFEEYQSPDSIKEEFSKEGYASLVHNFKETEMGDLKLITWEEDFFELNYYKVMIIGRDYNYSFSTLAQNKNDLLEIVRTVDLF
ncbi:MAG: hypothetical protein GF347_01060 [Candidatus Moranbacteria bacterium]|nr:hypothetical protein [Candidatus Moranbacteria bacterium]